LFCLIVQRFGDEPMPPHMLVAAGALAGLAASTATFPLEVRALLHSPHAGPTAGRAFVDGFTCDVLPRF
jgi:hypothetical protein